MTYDEALEKMVAEGAIRAFRLSDSTAYVYRLKDNQYEVRTLVGANGSWEPTKTAVSRTMGRNADGWYAVLGVSKEAKPIQSETAKKNPGYSQVSTRQCYTCKLFKPEAEFERPGSSGDQHRNWECNECYGRRQREQAAYKRITGMRKGDFLDRETLASPPPPQGKI
jgi:hypothetical protein